MDVVAQIEPAVAFAAARYCEALAEACETVHLARARILQQSIFMAFPPGIA
jgi:hypothetical protein